MIDCNDLAQKTGLTFEKSRNLLFGIYQNYMIMVANDQEKKQCSIFFSVKGPDQNADLYLSQKLKAYADENKLKSAEFNKHVVAVVVQIHMKTSADVIFKIINDLAGICRECYFVSCCESCGTQEMVEFYSALGSYAFLCPTCFENAKSALSEAQQDLKKKKTNYFLGIIGAILGSLAGVIIWVIAAQFGYIVGVSGLVFAIGSLWGFTKLGGKLNIGGLIVSLAVAAAMLFASEYISAAIQIFTNFKDTYSITFFDALGSVSSFLQYSSISSAFIGDLVIGYIFFGIAAIFSSFSMFKSANLKYEMKKLG